MYTKAAQSLRCNLGRHEDAITDFDEAIRLNPGDADAWANRGLAKISLGRHEDAIADYDKSDRTESTECRLFTKAVQSLRCN